MDNLHLADSNFQQLMRQLYISKSVEKTDLRINQLSIESKFELIKMKSSGWLTFENNKITVSAKGEEALLSVCANHKSLQQTA